MICPEGCMKQIDECLQRVVNGQPPHAKRKWKGFLQWNGFYYELHLYHYHHLVLKYRFMDKKVLYEWWEKPADKRGLDSAKLWLKAYHEHNANRFKK
jgi:hypothetical protein